MNVSYPDVSSSLGSLTEAEDRDEVELELVVLLRSLPAADKLDVSPPGAADVDDGGENREGLGLLLDG